MRRIRRGAARLTAADVGFLFAGMFIMYGIVMAGQTVQNWDISLLGLGMAVGLLVEAWQEGKDQ